MKIMFEAPGPAVPKARQILNNAIPEKDFLAQIIQLAQLKGWAVHHVFEQKHFARRVGEGFPDLVMVRPPHLLFVEVKSQKGKLTEAQIAWLKLLYQVGGPYTRSEIWRPSDWEKIEESLE